MVLIMINVLFAICSVICTLFRLASFLQLWLATTLWKNKFQQCVKSKLLLLLPVSSLYNSCTQMNKNMSRVIKGVRCKTSFDPWQMFPGKSPMQLGIHHTTLQRVSLKNSSYKTVQIQTQNNYCLEPNLMSFKTQGFESIAPWACLDQSPNPGLWSFPFPHLLLSPTSLPIHPLTVASRKAKKGFPIYYL